MLLVGRPVLASLATLAAVHPRAGRTVLTAARAADEGFMLQALLQAEAAAAAGEVPIGAVAVRDGEVLAVAHNKVEALQDASAHAEMLCARAAAAKSASWRLENTTLYCTVEPCPMCLAAMHAFRVERLVYGAPNARLGAVVGDLRAAQPLGELHPFHSVEVTGGVLAEPAAQLMQDFFRKRRSEPGKAQPR
jgi:tRNA(adenine34) deaminase